MACVKQELCQTDSLWIVMSSDKLCNEAQMEIDLVDININHDGVV